MEINEKIWLISDASKEAFTGVKQVSSLSDSCTFEGRAAEEVPLTLCIVSPSGQSSCEGEYHLVASHRPNDAPVWKHWGTDRWLYSSNTGRWCIGGMDVLARAFNCSAGFLYQTERHDGAMPHLCKACWARWDGDSFKVDSAIRALAHSPLHETNLFSALDARTVSDDFMTLPGDRPEVVVHYEAKVVPGGNSGPFCCGDQRNTARLLSRQVIKGGA